MVLEVSVDVATCSIVVFDVEASETVLSRPYDVDTFGPSMYWDLVNEMAEEARQKYQGAEVTIF